MVGCDRSHTLAARRSGSAFERDGSTVRFGQCRLADGGLHLQPPDRPGRPGGRGPGRRAVPPGVPGVADGAVRGRRRRAGAARPRAPSTSRSRAPVRLSFPDAAGAALLHQPADGGWRWSAAGASARSRSRASSTSTGWGRAAAARPAGRHAPALEHAARPRARARTWACRCSSPIAATRSSSTTPATRASRSAARTAACGSPTRRTAGGSTWYFLIGADLRGVMGEVAELLGPGAAAAALGARLPPVDAALRGHRGAAPAAAHHPREAHPLRRARSICRPTARRSAGTAGVGPPRVPARAVAGAGRPARRGAARSTSRSSPTSIRCSTRTRRCSPRPRRAAICWRRATSGRGDRRADRRTIARASATSTSRTRRRAPGGGRRTASCVELGVAGWWLDGGEGPPAAAQLARRRRRAAAQPLRPLPPPGLRRGRGGRPARISACSCSAARARPACSASAPRAGRATSTTTSRRFEAQVPLGLNTGLSGRAVLGHRRRRLLPPGPGDRRALRALVPVRRLQPDLPLPRLGLARARAVGARPRGGGDLPPLRRAALPAAAVHLHAGLAGPHARPAADARRWC